jgi:hypothetical protein
MNRILVLDILSPKGSTLKGPFARHLQESHVTNPARASLSLLFLRAVAGNWKLSLWLPFAGSSLAVRKHTVLGHNCKRYSGVAVACLCRVRSQWVGSSWYILPVFCGSFHEALGPVCALGRGGPLPGNYASKARAKASDRQGVLCMVLDMARQC